MVLKGVVIERGFYGSGFKRSVNDLTPVSDSPALVCGIAFPSP